MCLFNFISLTKKVCYLFETSNALLGRYFGLSNYGAVDTDRSACPEFTFVNLCVHYL